MKLVVIDGYNPEFSSASVLDAAGSILDGFRCMTRSQSIWTKMGRRLTIWFEFAGLTRKIQRTWDLSLAPVARDPDLGLGLESRERAGRLQRARFFKDLLLSSR
jgi:hypothetical protein